MSSSPPRSTDKGVLMQIKYCCGRRKTVKKLLNALMCAWALLIAAAAGAHAAERVTYRVSVNVDWSPETHPLDYPEGAHWSGLFAAVHDERYSLFADGDTATTGLALLAANGRFSILLAEYDEAERRRRVAANAVVRPPIGGSGAFVFTIEVSEDYPMLSFATMLAPSPDWFAGVADIALYDGETWADQLSLPVFMWDAGSDSGPTFTSRDAPTQPRESVRLLAHPSFLQATGLKPIGTVTVLRETPVR